jgi:hypothetical protein
MYNFNNKASYCIFLLLISPFLANAQQSAGSFRNYYTGLRDDGLKFQMDLIIDPEQVEGTIKVPSTGESLHLTGILSDQGAITLHALNDKDSVKKTLYCRIGPFSSNINGTWLDASDTKLRKFRIKKVAEYLVLRQETGFIKAQASIPQFLKPRAPWQQLNLWINDINSEIINNFVSRKEDQLVLNKTNIFLGWQYQVNYIVSYYSEDFLSLLIKKDEYSISDKPDVTFSTSNIELRDNSFKNIKLSDLFLPSTDYIEKLSEYAIKDLTDQNALWVEDKKIRFLDKNFLNLFLVTEGYIEFAFPPGIVAPSEDGAYFVKIPYDYIAPYANPGGLLNRFIKYNGINYLEFSP